MMPPWSRASLADGFFLTGDGVWSSLLVLLLSGPAHAFAGKFDAMSVMNEAVQDGFGVSGVADDLVPAVRRWALAGLWEHLLEAQNETERVGESVQMINSTILRAHHCAAGAKGGLRVRILGAQEVAL